jgi:hypothetical protein
MKWMKSALLLQAIFTIGFGIKAVGQNGYNKEAFYDAMSGTNLQQVEQQIKEAEKASGTDKQAIIGTLTMKKAGLISGAGKKLKAFKAGHKELEASISQDKDNAEYRFMRLMIQENAPGILGYKGEIDTDSDYLRKSFKTLPGTLQKAIVHYAKTSKVLSEKDFN